VSQKSSDVRHDTAASVLCRSSTSRRKRDVGSDSEDSDYLPPKRAVTISLAQDIPSHPQSNGDEHAIRRWREDMTAFRANTMAEARKNAEIFISGVETQCKNSVSVAMDRAFVAEAICNKIKGEAAMAASNAKSCIERLKEEIQMQISTKISSAAEARKLLAAQVVRAAAAEAKIAVLQSLIDDAKAPKQVPDAALFSDADDGTVGHLGNELFGYEADTDIFNTCDLCVVPAPTDDWMDAETKAMKSAMQARGVLIQAIMAAVADPILKASVESLMTNAATMPPTFDELVDMLRSQRNIDESSL
jgi:hypothetical protein